MGNTTSADISGALPGSEPASPTPIGAGAPAKSASKPATAAAPSPSAAAAAAAGIKLYRYHQTAKGGSWELVSGSAVPRFYDAHEDAAARYADDGGGDEDDDDDGDDDEPPPPLPPRPKRAYTPAHHAHAHAWTARRAVPADAAAPPPPPAAKAPSACKAAEVLAASSKVAHAAPRLMRLRAGVASRPRSAPSLSTARTADNRTAPAPDNWRAKAPAAPAPAQ